MQLKKTLVIVLATTFATAAFSQVGTSIKESGKAVAESTKEGGDNAKAAVESQPDKAIDKSKARMHKAKAHAHRHRAKAAAKEATH